MVIPEEPAQPLPAPDGPFERSAFSQGGEEDEVSLPLMASLPVIMSEIRSEGAPERRLTEALVHE